MDRQEFCKLAFVSEVTACGTEILCNVVAERKLEVFVHQAEPAA